MKQLRVLRGLPGSGKSFLANQMREQEGALVFSNDELMTVNNVYYWEENKAAKAHHRNQELVAQAMRQDKPLLVLDNCNLKPYHVAPYIRLAFHYGYDWKLIMVNTPWAFDMDELERRNEHGVEKDVIENMCDDLLKMTNEALYMILRWEVPMDPEITLREAQEALEKRLFTVVDERLYDYQDWVRIGGYSPDGGDEAAESISDKLQRWRENAYINVAALAC